MFQTIRELFVVVRESLGMRWVVGILLLVLLVSPIILALIVLGLVFSVVALVWNCGSWAWGRCTGVGKRLDDPVFGPVIYQGGSVWHAERELSALGGRLAIEVWAPATTGPGPPQHEMLSGLIARQEDIRRQLQESLFREYQIVAPETLRLLESVGSHNSHDLAASLGPHLDDPAQIWALLSDGYVMLEEEPGTFSISWNCTWDDEHGLVRTFVNWRLQEDQ